MTAIELTLRSVRDQLHTHPEKITDIVSALDQRVQAVDGKVRAYINYKKPSTISPIQSKLSLAGVPISVKDNICTEGWDTTCASLILQGHVPPYNATVIEKLKAAGAWVFAKCDMDEFAFGSSTETSAYGRGQMKGKAGQGPVANPWNLDCVPGGSSGGSAACVSAGTALAALGSDTGGSIRQPASFCGVVGMKPTYGRVSRFGLIAFGSSLDQIGPLTRTVEDNAILLEAIAGYDIKDSTSVNQPVPTYSQHLKKEVKDLKIGLPKEYFVKGLNPEIEKSVRAAATVFTDLGAQVVEIDLPHTRFALPVYYVVAVAEASSNLARFDGVEYGRRAKAENLAQMYFQSRGEGFGAEVKRRILLGTFTLSAGYYDAYYLRAQKVRNLIKQDFVKAFEKVDLILAPTAPTPAFRFGEKTSDPLSMYLSDIYTIPANLAGIPAMSLPCGFSSYGLPIGLQLMANYFKEETIYRAAYAFEQATDYHTKRPAL